MPKIENSFAKKITLDYTLFHPEFSIFVHNAIKDKVNKKDKIIDIDKDSYKVLR